MSRVRVRNTACLSGVSGPQRSHKIRALTLNHKVNPKNRQIQLVLGLEFVQFLDPLLVKEYIICK